MTGFPITKPELTDALHSLYDLRKMDAKPLLKKGKWSTRYPYKYKKSAMYIDFDSTGIKFSDHFHFEARMCCDSLNSPSPIRSWYNTKFKAGLENCDIAKGNMKTAIAMRKYIASQFRPSAAKCLYDTFKAKHIYDPCMGWGDRLAGFMASSALSYTGTDVNPHLFLGYEKQTEFIDDENKKVDFYLERAEKFLLGHEVDFIFTSPPYFDIERYEGMWQSHANYKTLDKWKEGFLFKMLENALSRLKQKGHMAINISDVYGHHTVNKICDDMCDYITQKLGLTYRGCIGYRMRKRPNSKANGDIFCEPIWIFRKD